MIFCVEDDKEIRELMIYALNSTGFEAAGFEDGTAFFNALNFQKPQLIMLDIMLPKEDGITILKKIRSNPATANIPVIMATAKGTEYDKVIGLDNGADDYLAKPFGMMEMIARVKAVLRRSGWKKNDELLRFKNLEMNLAEHCVWLHQQYIELTLKEYELLYLFMSHPGRVFTRNQLLKQIWNTDYEGETRTVDVHIGTLRSKLKEYKDYIETVRGVGYKMEDKK